MTGWTVLIATHAFAALVCLPIGAYQLLRRSGYGDRRHRIIGRAWVAGMIWVAVSSFWIRDIREGAFSLLHALSVVTLVSVVGAVVAIRRGNVRAHRSSMRGAWFGAMGAFVGAVAVPDRLIPTFVIDEPGPAALALLAVTATAAGVVGAGVLVDRQSTQPMITVSMGISPKKWGKSPHRQ